MTTVTAQHSSSYWNRVRFGLIAMVAAVALTIALVAWATSGSGSTTPKLTHTGHVGAPTPCVPIGGSRIC